MTDGRVDAIEVSPEEARRMEREGLPDGVELHERNEVDWWGRTYAETDSGLYVPEEENPVDEEIRRIQEQANARPGTSGTCIDLFCGCGGFSLGMHMAGFDVVAAVDNAPEAAVTYLLNLGRPDCELVFTDDGAREEWELRGKDEPLEEWAGSSYRESQDMETGCRGFVFGDIRKVSGDDLLEAAGVDEVDVVVGGPPCQGLSTMNAQACLEDPRNGMLWEYMRLIRELEPRAWLMENVPRLLTTADGALFEALSKIANEAGYYVRAQICDASHYGVPQYRRRALVAGTHEESGRPYQFPMPETWAAGRDPDGDGWNTGKWWSGGPAYGDVEQGPEVEVEYDPETGTFQFAADVDEEEAEPAEQQELL